MHFTHRCEPKISFDRNVGKSLGHMIYRVVVELKSLKTQIARNIQALKKYQKY